MCWFFVCFYFFVFFVVLLSGNFIRCSSNLVCLRLFHFVSYFLLFKISFPFFLWKEKKIISAFSSFWAHFLWGYRFFLLFSLLLVVIKLKTNFWPMFWYFRFNRNTNISFDLSLYIFPNKINKNTQTHTERHTNTHTHTLIQIWLNKFFVPVDCSFNSVAFKDGGGGWWLNDSNFCFIHSTQNNVSNCYVIWICFGIKHSANYLTLDSFSTY